MNVIKASTSHTPLPVFILPSHQLIPGTILYAAVA